MGGSIVALPGADYIYPEGVDIKSGLVHSLCAVQSMLATLKKVISIASSGVFRW